MPWYSTNPELFVSEQRFISSNHPDMHFMIEDGVVLLIGTLHISTNVDGKSIAGDYMLKLVFPRNYPKMYPVVYDLNNSIPKNFHTNPDKTLCLTTPIETSEIFFRNNSLENFINSLLIPYLIGYLYYRDYKVMPYGERLHGIDGKLEYYKEKFNTEKNTSIIKFLQIAVKKNVRGHQLCPCGSNKRIRDCHATEVKSLFPIPKELLNKEIAELKY